MSQITKEDVDVIIRAAKNGANNLAIIDFLLDLRNILDED